MAFDAGAIEASLTVRLDQFDRDMDKAEARVKRFEDGKHQVKISAVFDQSDMSRARQMFAQLDQSISKDAMSRLRSSPQGSVLGALNALFSPHPVTGAPTASQAAQQGLLGKMISGQGGGVGSTSGRNVIKDVIGVNDNAAKAQGAKAGKDAADAANTAAAAEARKSGGLLGGLFGGGASSGGKAGRAGDGGGGGNESFLDRGLLGAIGPGILGMGFLKSSIVGLGASAVGALPALGAAGLGVGAIGGGAALLLKSNTALQNQAKSMLKGIEATLTSAAGPLVKPLESAFSQLGGFVKQIGPQIGSVFKAVAPLIQPLTYGLEGLVGGLLPGLVSILRAAAPAMKVFAGFLGGLGADLGKMLSQFSTVIGPSSVLLKALLDLVSALFPFLGGLAQIMASVLAPAFVQFAGILRGLLPSLTVIAKVIAEFAGAVLVDLAGGLGIVAGILKAVTPAINQLAGVIGQVFTTLENKGVLAQFGDILENLAVPVGNLISSLITGLIPVLPTAVTLFSDLVNVLSQVGTSVIAGLLPPLTVLATTVLSAIAQVLPQIVPAFVALTQALLSPGLILAITNLVTQLARIITAVAPTVIVAISNAIISIITAVTQPGVVGAITDVVNWLADLIQKVPAPVLQGIALGLLGIAAAVKAIQIGNGVLSSLTGLVSTLKGIPSAVKGTLSKIFGGPGESAGTVDVAASGMQKAGDTMATAAEAMQKAADTMTGATLESDAGAAGAGAEDASGAEAGAAAAGVGGLLRSAFGTALIALIAGNIAGIIAKTVHPATGAQISAYQSAVPGPVQAVPNTLFGGPGNVASLLGPVWSPGAPRALGASPKGAGSEPAPGSAAYTSYQNQLQSSMASPVDRVWSTAYEDFQRDFAGKVTSWFTKSLPGFFTKSIPAVWSGDYETFMRQYGSPVASWFTSSLPHAFTGTLPRLVWSPVYEGFMRDIGSPVSNWFTSTLPSFFARMGGDVGSFFSGLPGMIGSALSGLGGELLSIGESAMSSLVAGMESEIPGGHGIGGAVGSALHAIGFADGGLLTEPIVGFGTRTGQLYTLAENEPEWVVPSSAMGSGPGGSGQAGPSSQLAENLYIMQPEGSTIAQAFNEIQYQVSVARMQGFIGAAT